MVAALLRQHAVVAARLCLLTRRHYVFLAFANHAGALPALFGAHLASPLTQGLFRR